MMNVGGWAICRAGINILFPEHNSATVWNILTKLCKIIEQVNEECRCKNDNSASLWYLIISLDHYFYFISGLYLSHPLKYYNDTL